MKYEECRGGTWILGTGQTQIMPRQKTQTLQTEQEKI